MLPAVLTLGDLTIDTRAQRVEKRGVHVPLTAKEYALLDYLARRRGVLVSRADITAHVWDENHDPSSNTLEVYINRLRKKIDDADAPSHIQTRRGRGLSVRRARTGTAGLAAVIRTSVRTRLSIWHSGLLAFLVTMFAVASYGFLRRTELARIDSTLQEQSEIVAQSMSRCRGRRYAHAH